MRIQFIRDLEVFIKNRLNRLRIDKNNFTIISNNCWGTFIYKKFGLPYNSPFVNLFIFAPDYIKLLQNFDSINLEDISFIEKSQSKYKTECIACDIYDSSYPIGLLEEDIELHFLHYTSKEDAKEKWLRRCKKINYDRLILKFSDGDNCTDEHLEIFDELPFKNKVAFTSSPKPGLKSVVFIEKYKNAPRVQDEWKSFHKHNDNVKTINNLD
jgi:uncharacterized protein (DUF1919 family)